MPADEDVFGDFDDFDEGSDLDEADAALAKDDEDEPEDDEEDDEDEPEEEDGDQPDDDELEASVVIQDRRRGGYEAVYEGEAIAEHADRDVLLKAVRKWMKVEGYYPNVYYVNDRGNLDLLDPRTGKSLRSWV